MGRKLFNIKNMAIVAVFSLIAFVGFNSFISTDSARPVNPEWFVLKTGIIPNKTNALISSNYIPSVSEPCSDGSIYCGVLADNVLGEPDLSSTPAESEVIAFFDNNIEGVLISAKD